MEAPENIYLTPLMLFAAPTISSSDNDVEYIRTDFFIEKACKAYCKVCKMPNCRSRECKSISTFRNYMTESK